MNNGDHDNGSANVRKTYFEVIDFTDVRILLDGVKNLSFVIACVTFSDDRDGECTHHPTRTKKTSIDCCETQKCRGRNFHATSEWIPSYGCSHAELSENYKKEKRYN